MQCKDARVFKGIAAEYRINFPIAVEGFFKTQTYFFLSGAFGKKNVKGTQEEQRLSQYLFDSSYVSDFQADFNPVRMCR